MPFPFAGPVIAGLGSLLGGLFGNSSSQQQSTTPTIDPTYGPLQSLVLQSIRNRLASPGSGLPTNYEASGVGAINRTYDAANQNLTNELTARGLSTSPIAGNALAMMNRGRSTDIGNFRANIPLVQRQLQDQDLGLATNLIGLGRGASSSGSGTVGGGLGGGFDSLATMLGYLYGEGAFTRSASSNGLPGYSAVPL